ncbi:hypothetical protein ACFLTH_11065 [Bacteroidota bacterium]
MNDEKPILSDEQLSDVHKRMSRANRNYNWLYLLIIFAVIGTFGYFNYTGQIDFSSWIMSDSDAEPEPEPETNITVPDEQPELRYEPRVDSVKIYEKSCTDITKNASIIEGEALFDQACREYCAEAGIGISTGENYCNSVDELICNCKN